MQEVKGKYNTAKVFTDSLEESGREQIERLWDQPYAADSKIRMMLDVHAGAGCTIGTTMTIADKICPNLVGVDIGCGMETLIDTDVMILRKGSVSARKGENFWFQSIWEIEVSSVLENGMKTGTIRHLMEMVV